MADQPSNPELKENSGLDPAPESGSFPLTSNDQNVEPPQAQATNQTINQAPNPADQTNFNQTPPPTVQVPETTPSNIVTAPPPAPPPMSNPATNMDIAQPAPPTGNPGANIDMVAPPPPPPLTPPTTPAPPTSAASTEPTPEPSSPSEVAPAEVSNNPAYPPQPYSASGTQQPSSTQEAAATSAAEESKPLTAEEMGPPWLRGEQTTQPKASPEGSSFAETPLSQVPPPWQVPSEHANTVPNVMTNEHKEGAFPAVIFIILVLGIVVAIAAFLFTQGIIPFGG